MIVDVHIMLKSCLHYICIIHKKTEITSHIEKDRFPHWH